MQLTSITECWLEEMEQPTARGIPTLATEALQFCGSSVLEEPLPTARLAHCTGSGGVLGSGGNWGSSGTVLGSPAPGCVLPEHASPLDWGLCRELPHRTEPG